MASWGNLWGTPWGNLPPSLAGPLPLHCLRQLCFGSLSCLPPARESGLRCVRGFWAGLADPVPSEAQLFSLALGKDDLELVGVIVWVCMQEKGCG